MDNIRTKTVLGMRKDITFKVLRIEPNAIAIKLEEECEPIYLKREIALAWNYADRELLGNIGRRAAYLGGE